MNFWPLLRSLLLQRRYQWYYSPPQLVNGGLAPPPSKFYPGTKCYMVVLTINNVPYYGFGPSPSIAKHYAIFEAYNSLHPLPSEEVERHRNTIPAHVIDSPSDSDQDDGDQLLNRSREPSLKPSNELSEREASPDEEETNADGRPPPVMEGSPSQCGGVSRGNGARGTQDVQERGLPGNTDELEKRIRALPLDREPRSLVWIHDESVANLKQRDVFTDVEELAQRKGVCVSYNFRQCDPLKSRAVMCIAKAAGYQFTGRHSEKPLFAKHEAAVKLFTALTKLPDVAITQELSPPTTLPARNGNGTSSAPELSQKLEQKCENRSPTSSLSFVSHNPIGQLQELMAKEKLSMPVYTESVNTCGEYTEYTCIVKAKEFSAKGVGCSKKLARRHAAENILALMHSEHMIIVPDLVSPKKHRRPRPFRRCRSFPHCGNQRPCLLPHPPGVQPLYAGGPMGHPRPHMYPPRVPPSNHMRGRPLPLDGHFAHRPPGCPPPPYCATGRPPMAANFVQESETESESESDTAGASSGLCEITPSNSSVSNHEMCPAAHYQTSPTATSLSPQMASKPHPQDSGLLTAERRQLSEIEPPFDAHSDPFHFTIRLPRERKEPWTNPPTLKELNVRNVNAKPPWCELKRASDKSPSSATPLVLSHQKDEHSARAYKERFVVGRKSISPSKNSPTKSSAITQDGVRNSPREIEVLERCSSDSNCLFSNSESFESAAGKVDITENQKSGISLDRVEGGVANDEGVSAGCDEEVTEEESGLPSCQLLKEHPLVKEFKEKGRSSVPVDQSAAGQSKNKGPTKTGPAVGYLPLSNHFKDDEIVSVCMPSEGAIVTVT